MPFLGEKMYGNKKIKKHFSENKIISRTSRERERERVSEKYRQRERESVRKTDWVRLCEKDRERVRV